MNIILYMFSILLVFAHVSHADPTEFSKSGGTTSNVPNAALNTVVAVLRTFEKTDIPKDTLSGSCSFREAACAGAVISLYENNKRIFVATLTAPGDFKIPNLKKNENYKFQLEWLRHNLKEVRTVTAGEFISINLQPAPVKN